MVYSGKPSRACHACRQRNTKCDLKPEGCTQCMRARRTCPGYRNQVDLMFRYENAKFEKSSAIESSVSLPHASASEQVPIRKKATETSIVQVAQDANQGALYWLSPASIEERADRYFNSNFSLGLEAPSFGYFPNIVDYYRSNFAEKPLLTSLKAVSLASFAYHSKSSNLVILSRQYYAEAIALTNLALQSSQDATKDCTLLSVLLLALYESLTACSKKSLDDWSRHINGAAALIQLRGYEQVLTRAGSELFFQATTGLLTCCIQNNVPFPSRIMEMTKTLHQQSLAGKGSPEQIAGYLVHLSVMDFNQFRASWDSPDRIDVQSNLRRAREIDDALATVYNDPPPSWSFQQRFTENASSEVVYGNIYHQYSSIRVASTWNNIRAVRLLLQTWIEKMLLLQTIHGCPESGTADYGKQLEASREIGQEMLQGILASVPQHLGYFQEGDGNGEGLGRSPKTPASNGYYLAWPLFVAGVVDFASEDAREYCKNRLLFICREMGIKQAFVLREMVDYTRRSRDPSSA